MESRKSRYAALAVILIGVAWLAALQSNSGPEEDGFPAVEESPLHPAQDVETSPSSKNGAFDARREELVATVVRGLVHERATEDCTDWRNARPEEDEIWRDILKILVFSPWIATTGSIVHSPTLNPRSIPMPNAEYAAISTVLDLYVDHFEQLNGYMCHVRINEVRALEAAGKLLDKPTERQLQEKADELAQEALRTHQHPEEDGLLEEIANALYHEAKRGSPTSLGFVKFKQQGKPARYFPADKLNNTNRIRDYARFRGQELAYFLVEYFAHNGYLTAEEREACLSYIQQLRNS